MAEVNGKNVTQFGGSINLIPTKQDPDPSVMVEGVPISSGSSSLESEIVVTQSNAQEIFNQPINPNKEYVIDGIIDLTGLSTNITITANGVAIRGVDPNISQIICSDDNYTLFVSDVGGSGAISIRECSIEINGNNSQVYNITDVTGNNLIVKTRVNYNNCTSLGEINGYVTALETNTGRFGGQPQLTLSGTWLGGYVLTTSANRAFIDGNYSLFSAGTNFEMFSRFRTNANADLPANVSYLDFAPSNFPIPSTLQIDGAIITRNGVTDASDTNITPNVTQADLCSAWGNNVGIGNTFEGGKVEVQTEVTTPINVVGQFESVLANAWLASDLQHFEFFTFGFGPFGAQMEHLGNSPRDYKIVADLIVDGNPNAELALRFNRFVNSTSTVEEIFTQVRPVNSFVGSRDVAFFTINVNVTLDQNDRVFLEIANNTNIQDVLLENGSYFTIEER